MKTLLIIILMMQEIICTILNTILRLNNMYCTILFPRHFMSDSLCENMEKAVWMAEKNLQCVSQSLLAGNVEM